MCGGMPSTPSAPKPPPMLPEAPQPPPMTRTTNVGPMMSAVARASVSRRPRAPSPREQYRNFGSESPAPSPRDRSTILGG